MMHGLANPKNLFVYVMNLRVYPKPINIPVLSLLENVGSMPDDVRKAYTRWLRSEPAMIEAGTMGWVHRRRLYWVSGFLGGLKPADWSWGSSSKSDVPAIQFQGAKPTHIQPGLNEVEHVQGKLKSALYAGLGTQRFSGNSSRGLDHLLPPGLGKDDQHPSVPETSTCARYRGSRGPSFGRIS